ncbi:MAG: hypothetical protein CM1200mP9_10620 [Gammaproteobacteria bacterium]|nr:MAG: hypothetical protein CM1200mP9_10620 [Gammaproteobacteria bacterium]
MAQDGQWNFIQQAAGMHASVARWLKERDVAVIGWMAYPGVMPSGVTGRFNPLHELVLIGLGMPIFDNLDLESLAEENIVNGTRDFSFCRDSPPSFWCHRVTAESFGRVLTKQSFFPKIENRPKG